MEQIKVEDLINNPDFVIDDFVGYVYITTHIPTGRQYIGRKAFSIPQLRN